MLKILFAIVLASCSLSSFAQATQPLSVHTDVVSIKENHSEEEKGYLQIPPNGSRIIVRNTPMFRIIGFAFNKQRNDLIEGLPQWTRDLKWDIEATIAQESIPVFQAMPFEEQKEVLQQILIDRCHFSAHPGEKEVPVFALTIAKYGLKVKPVSAEETDAAPKPAAQSIGWDLSQSRGKINARHLPIEGLLYALSKAGLSRQVVDRTGLTGRYDIHVEWTPDDSSGQDQDARSSEIPPPSIFTALEEQLGLKLEATRTLVPAVIVTHIEKPSAN
jgi:uncharacterized protein (TIGR03435 family)